MIFIKHSTYSASSPGFLVTIGEHTSSHFCCSGLGHCNLVGINICCGRGVGMAKLIGGGDNINTICNHCGSGGTTLYTISKETGLPFCILSRECCSLPSTTFSKRMSHTIRNYTTGVTALRQNTGQFLWRRPSSFCSVRAISLPPALLDRLCYHIFFSYRKVVCFCAPFWGWCSNYNVSNFFLPFLGFDNDSINSNFFLPAKRFTGIRFMAS